LIGLHPYSSGVTHNDLPNHHLEFGDGVMNDVGRGKRKEKESGGRV